MPLSPLEYLRHILDEAEYLINESSELGKEQFLQDKTRRRAFGERINAVG
jgi:uncharacterized protein with HEPN domain